MSQMKKEAESSIRLRLRIMKALGWYISVHKEIKQIKIANRMHTDPASISRYVISPKDAQCINEQNYEQSGKRLIDIEKAVEICGHMGTTLENILYYYQFKNTLDKLPNFDSLEKLTNQLMCVENEKENTCLLYTSPSPRDKRQSRRPSSA